MTLVTRRTTVAGSLAAALAAAAPGRASAQAFALPGPVWREDAADGLLAALEARHGGKLGVAALDVSTGRRLSHRADERFPILSVFKMLAAALALSHVDTGAAALSERIVIMPADVVPGSPAMSPQVGGEGVTLQAVCDAAVTRSDNTAGNLLLARYGGPAGLTAFARTLGDAVTRLDRTELMLNEAAAGDERDTTSPAAIVQAMRALLFGDALSQGSRIQLHDWLAANATGDARLRAGFPVGWRVGDKTGTGENGAANDVAIVQTPAGRAVIVAVLYAWSETTPENRSAVIADVARLVTVAFG